MGNIGYGIDIKLDLPKFISAVMFYQAIELKYCHYVHACVI